MEVKLLQFFHTWQQRNKDQRKCILMWKFKCGIFFFFLISSSLHLSSPFSPFFSILQISNFITTVQHQTKTPQPPFNTKITSNDKLYSKPLPFMTYFFQTHLSQAKFGRNLMRQSLNIPKAKIRKLTWLIQVHREIRDNFEEESGGNKLKKSTNSNTYIHI